jgi:cytochrome c553
MKRSTILAATLLFVVAPLAMATAPIMKEAKAKNPKITTCKDCHSALPGTKANLNEEGKKWVK